MNLLLFIFFTFFKYLFKLKLLSVFIHLRDVMGAKVVNQFVKSLLVFRAVDVWERFYCFSKLTVQLGSAGHSIAAKGKDRPV